MLGRTMVRRYAALGMGDERADRERQYRDHVQQLVERYDSHADAMQQAVGGEFDAIGQMELDLLISVGLPVDGFLVDVGCGSGRLAAPLASYLRGDYLGIDVVPELLDHARGLAQRPEWRFELCSDLVIPAENGTADTVCFFSVFTHLPHEDTYQYLQEAHRVLRPGGRVVFSFLEFLVRSHWDVFEADLQARGQPHHLNQFISRDGIEAWADHLGFEVESVWAGDESYIPLSKPIDLNGTRFDKFGSFGQSAAVLRS
jgi:SAM-dependent methyltransferase